VDMIGKIFRNGFVFGVVALLILGVINYTTWEYFVLAAYGSVLSGFLFGIVFVGFAMLLPIDLNKAEEQ
jgi:hypothetical protein